MHLGVVMSAGGAAFEATARIVAGSGITFHVVTDRECGAEQAAKRVGVPVQRIVDRSRTSFSKNISKIFAQADVERCLLLFDRLVTADLFEAIPTANVHPAILPAFPGLSAVVNARAHRVRLLGCSLHQVDASVDGGPILAQIACGVDPDWPIARWNTLAYLMKIYCVLVWCNASAVFDSDVVGSINVSHGLPSIWIDRFRQLQNHIGEFVI